MGYYENFVERAEQRADELFRQEDVIDLVRAIRAGDHDGAGRALDRMISINVTLTEWVAQARASC